MTSMEQPGELSQEELRAYLEQLREADAADIVVQAYTMLGTGAEVKLGRPDARVLIDAMAGIVGAVQAAFGELGQRMQGGVAQLQMAQVEAERRESGAQPAEGATAGQPSAAQPSAAPAGQAAPQQPAGAATGQPAEQSVTDRLWIPGRGPDPRRR